MIIALNHKCRFIPKPTWDFVTAGAWRDEILIPDDALSLLPIEGNGWGTPLPLKALGLVTLGTRAFLSWLEARDLLGVTYGSSRHLFKTVAGVIVWWPRYGFMIGLVLFGYMVIWTVIGWVIYFIIWWTWWLKSCLALTNHSSLGVTKGSWRILTENNSWLWSIVMWSRWFCPFLLFLSVFQIHPRCRKPKSGNDTISLLIFIYFNGVIILWSRY
jgi:hypothetical protein